MQHPDKEVQSAIQKLNDALCSWERATGRRSIFILKEEGGFIEMFDSGKPFNFDGIPVQHLLEQVQ
jgi:hypothetical protein